jgi:hypothetical protein
MKYGDAVTDFVKGTADEGDIEREKYNQEQPW